jgi:hypothetical protein
VKQRLIRSAALAGAAALTVMTASPGYAATIVSQSSANALTISLDGNDADSGTVTATNDGTGETKTGETNPPIAVLGNQDLLDIGVLAQEAEAKMSGKGGVSAACSGIAGDGGSVVTIGESGCLTPGSPVGVSIANLDLSGSVLIDPESALGGLAPLNEIMDQIVGPLTAAISGALEPLGETGLGGTLGTVQAFCNATPGTADGDANIADSKLTLSLGGQTIDLVEFPASPPPNTKVVTDLDVVLRTILDALRVDLNNTLEGSLAPLSATIDPIQDQIVNTIVADIADQLAPLEENILDITLNKQSRPTATSIAVSAIDLRLLPAAAESMDGPLVGLEIANVTCRPKGRVTDNPGGPTDPGLPDVPTVVDSGVDGGAPAQYDWSDLAAGLLLLLGAAALIGYRRLPGR